MQATMRAVLLGLLLAVAFVSFVFVRTHQGDSGTLVARQQHAQALTPANVAKAVRAAPDPVAEPTHTRGVRASCASLGTGALLNPWRCSIRYPSGRLIEYQVTIHADGSYVGDHELVRYRGQRYGDTGVITGCCVSLP
jgi:hypothetical protein